MKIFLVLATITFTVVSGFADPLPLKSYECTSIAKFYMGDKVVKTDKQVAVAGYIKNHPAGMEYFKHTFNSHTVHTAIQTDVGAYIESNERFSSAWYFHLSDTTVEAKHISDSRFEVIEAELPQVFAITLNTAKLSSNLSVNLRVVCKVQ